MINNMILNPFFQHNLAASQALWQQNAGLQSQSAQSFGLGLGLGLGGMGVHTYVMSIVQEMQREVDDALKGWDL
jgi:hypothetical protein